MKICNNENHKNMYAYLMLNFFEEVMVIFKCNLYVSQSIPPSWWSIWRQVQVHARIPTIREGQHFLFLAIDSFPFGVFLYFWTLYAVRA